MDRVILFSDSLIWKKLSVPMLNEKILLTLNEEKSKNSGNKLSNVGGFQTKNIKDEFICKTLLSEASIMINEIYNLNDVNFTLANLWINENSKGDYNAMHTHTDSNFSAVYYVKVPKNSGNLVFSRTDTSVEWAQNWKLMNNTDTFSRHTISPDQNMLIVFSSHLQHHVTPNKSEQNRVSVSFNMWFNN